MGQHADVLRRKQRKKQRGMGRAMTGRAEGRLGIYSVNLGLGHSSFLEAPCSEAPGRADWPELRGLDVALGSCADFFFCPFIEFNGGIPDLCL